MREKGFENWKNLWIFDILVQEFAEHQACGTMDWVS